MVTEKGIWLHCSWNAGYVPACSLSPSCSLLEDRYGEDVGELRSFSTSSTPYCLLGERPSRVSGKPQGLACRLQIPTGSFPQRLL